MIKSDKGRVLAALYVEKGRAGKWIFSKCTVGVLVTPLRFPSALFNKITVAAFLPWRGSFHRKACKDRASTPPALSVQKHQNLFSSFGPGMKRVSGYKPPLAARPSPIYSWFEIIKRLLISIISMSCFELTCESKSSLARTGVLSTVHNKLETPFFMPVATKGAVKFVSHPQLNEMNVDCLISNAFINYLKPGLEHIKKAGGLHNFFGWDKSLFTDSGGFQLLSEDFVDHVTDKGVFFRNPFDKSIHLITPENAVQIQNSLGSDVAMCLDHVLHFGKSRLDYFDAMVRTTEWALRCKEAHKNPNQLLFGITQGGTFLDLRKKSTIALEAMDFDGLAFGGLCIGEDPKTMYDVTEFSKKFVSKEKPIYLMGVGSPLEILNLVERGVDIFDSAYPTRMARHGKIFTHTGCVQINRSKYKEDFSSLDSECDCFVCKSHSKSYLHHLFKTYEQNGLMLLSYHNTFFIANLIKEIRAAIKENNFEKFKKEFEFNYKNKK